MTDETSDVGRYLGGIGLALLSLGVATSSLTFNSIIDYDPLANFFPEFSGRVLYLSDGLLLAGVAIWVAGYFMAAPRALSLGPWYLAVPLVLLLMLSALSIVWADHPAQAGFATTRRLVLFAVYVVMVNDPRRALTAMVAGLAGVGFLHVAVERAQLIQGSTVGLAVLGEIPGEGLGVGCPRPIGLGFNPNPLGLFLAIAGAVAYSLFLLREGAWWLRAVTFASFAVAFSALLATLSRSATVGWFLGAFSVTLLVWLWKPDARRATIRRVLAAAALVAMATWLLPIAFPLAQHCGARPSRYSGAALSEGARGRAEDLALAEPVILEHPWLGVGTANYPLELRKRLPPGPFPPAVTPVPVHNVPLLLWAELGILGISSWLLILAAPLCWLRSRWRHGRADLHELLWLAPLQVLLFVSLLDFTPWATQDGRVLMMAVAGLWAGGISRGRVRPTERNDNTTPDRPFALDDPRPLL